MGLIITPDKIFGPGYKKFKLENGLYKPEIYTKEYKQDLLGDFGLASCISAKQLIGKAYPIEEIRELIRPYNTVLLFRYLAVLSNYLNLNGSKVLPKDKVQERFFNQILNHLKFLGLQVEQPDPSELKHQCVFSIDTINGLLGICLSIGFPGEQKIDLAKSSGNFLLSIIAINDHVVHPAVPTTPGSDEFHYENLRNIWFRGPLVTTPIDYFYRTHRFVEITRESLATSNNPNIDDYIREKYGVSYDEFCTLIPALTTVGYSVDEWKQPILNCTPPDNYSHQILIRFVSALSLSPDEYSKVVQKLLEVHGENFLGHQDFVRLLVDRPLICMEPGWYLLLGMHLLLRNIELSIDAAVISHEQPAEIQKLRSDLGNGAENYTRKLIQKCVQKFTDKDEIFYEDGNLSKQIGDAIILHPAISVLFEVKYRQPPIDHFDPTSDGLRKFIKWFEKSYLLSKAESKLLYGKDSRAGALHQLVRDSKRVLAGEIGKFKPGRVLPVIINPTDLVFSLDFYEMLDRMIDKINLLDDEPKIIKPLIMSIGDLEYIYGHNISDKKWSLRNILVEKATNSSARTSTWSLVLKKLGLTHSFPEDFRNDQQALVDKAAKFLKLSN